MRGNQQRVGLRLPPLCISFMRAPRLLVS